MPRSRAVAASLLALGLAIGAGIALVSPDSPGAPTPAVPVHATPHFRIESTARPGETTEIAEAAEALHAAWREVVGFGAATAHAPLRIRLYGDRAAFRRENRSRPWAEAYYLDGVAYAYFDARGRNRHHWALHEVAHQMNREVGGWRLPQWANEGIATYLSTSRLRDGILHPGELDPTAYPVYWLHLVATDADDTGIGLRALLTGVGAPPLDRTVNLHYVHWWSLAHFLFHGDGGRHADGFRRLLRGPGTLREFEREIGPVDEIEPRWRAHLHFLAAAHEAAE